ncbi:MAG: HD domain-containing protein [Gemmatimonadota bacterium]|nr:HD domain-containing protein [Gemmatimonadota bacterium]
MSSSSAVSRSEVLAALSYALDLTEGQRPGHTLRTCLIGMRLGEDIGLGEEMRSSLFYALLLKDAGCSSNAARMSSLFGSDDRFVKPFLKNIDRQERVRLALKTLVASGKGGNIVSRIRHFVGISRTADVTRDLISIRCERGAGIAMRLGFSEATANAIRSLDEHWNGGGHPEGLAGEEIPILSRIINICQTVEVFHSEHGIGGAIAVLLKRRGTWFDPALVDRMLKWRAEAEGWGDPSSDEIGDLVMALEPGGEAQMLSGGELDEIARAFADIIDAKSPFTYNHSTNVAAFAVAIARASGADATELQRIYRAGLLHDIGKLGVSNMILDKPGRLTPEERAEVELHPVFTNNILSHVRAFGDFAWTASIHHECLDGTGYPYKLTATQIDGPARMLCVADVFEALTADRPYRAGMTPEDALGLMRSAFATKLCAETVNVLESCYEGAGVVRKTS